jgi:hypothetical protein
MKALEEAKAFLVKAKDMTREALNAAYEGLSKEVQDIYEKLRQDEIFDPKNAAPERRDVFSPSGKYKLSITAFKTSPGCWSYTQGLVYRKDGDNPLAEIRRNYSAFPYLFIEGHPKGDFLVCGADYQGQTIIALDTGKRRDHLSDGADKGHGFCWASHKYEPSAQVLVVDGCIWACPYEFRFYDFSDPMSGWPELETGKCIYSDRMEPTFEADGTLKCYQTEASEDDDDDEGTLPKRPSGIAAFTRFRREGLKLIEIEWWVSDAEKDRRAQHEEAERKYEEWTKNFKATDPLYLTYAELVKDPALSPEEYMSVGQTYDDWGDDWKGKERRWCRRIITHKAKTGPTVDLEWAVDTGPIKIVLYRDGKSDGHKFFEHSVEGMKSAFAAAKEYAHVL